MLSKEQAELINNKSSIIEPCVKFAGQFLVLPDIEVFFDDCPSARFHTMDNAAESGIDVDGHGHIAINAPWFADRIEEHQDDVEFFIFHELRHIHQHTQIRLMVSGNKTREPISTVTEWIAGFDGYVRNDGGKSQTVNVTQEVEIDANAYGIALVNMYHADDDLEIHLSIPEEADKVAWPRAQQYIDTLPEILKFREQYTQKHQEKIKQTEEIKAPRKKIGRNDPCPCGSGKKYKKCCGK